MAGDLEVRPGLVIPAGELQERFTPSGGPGGQHANRSNTRVELRFDVAASQAMGEGIRNRLVARLGPEVRIVVDEERSQRRNREIARVRLATKLRAALGRPATRRPTRPSAGSVARRVDQKRRRSQTKQLRRRPPPE
jgi:ribosome-associated protein